MQANGTFVAPEMINGGGNLAGTSGAASSPGMDARSDGHQAKSSPSAFSGVESMPQGSPDPRVMVLAPGGSPQPGASVTAYFVPQPSAGPGGPEAQADLTFATADEAAQPDVTGSALLLLGLLLAVVSALVLVLAWLARRTTDPLLR